MVRVAILDDYQSVALEVVDWSALDGRAEITAFHEHLPGEDAVAEALVGFEVVVAMRERTAFPASLLRRLPHLRLLVTTGMRNSSIDLPAAEELGITICGTDSVASSTVEHTWALILAWSRHIVEEAGNMSAGRWQTTLGNGLAGKTLGIVGLGRIGSAVAAVGNAFGMRVVAWSQNLTTERADAAGAELVGFHELLADSDVVTVHLVLSDRTRHLIGAPEIARMRPSALLVNTSRGPIIDSAAAGLGGGLRRARRRRGGCVRRGAAGGGPPPALDTRGARDTAPRLRHPRGLRGVLRAGGGGRRCLPGRFAGAPDIALM